MSEFSHLKNKLLAEQVEDQIYHYILDEALEPGAKLPNEFALGEKFRVGRSTIREAVKLLSSKGIVERQQADEEAAPAHDPNPKNSRPRSDMLQGLAVIFYGKKSCFPGRCGTYFLSTGSAVAVTTMMRFVTCLPFSSTVL